MRRLLVSELIADVRSLLDEDNQAAVKDETDIIPALNRAQDIAANILSRHYESPLLTNQMITLTGGQDTYDIPEAAFEQRLEKVEVKITNYYYQIKNLSYRDLTPYESPMSAAIPYYYTVIGNQFKLTPSPTATNPIRVWYLKDPEPLVLEQGRITVVNTAQRYIVVDEPGSQLTTETDQLGSYVNLVDGSTGSVKCTLQIQSITGNRLVFKSTPSRDTVLGKTVVGEIPTTVEPDDYICLSSGSCIPVFKKPFSNYLIQFAMADLTRKLGGPADMENQLRQEMEKIVEHSWVGREQSLRVTKASKFWTIPSRRYYIGNS